MGMGNWSVAFCSASNIWWMIPGASILHFILNNCICFLRTRILGAGIKVDSTVHSFRIRDDNFYCLHLAYPTKIQFGVVALCRTGLRKAGLAWATGLTPCLPPPRPGCLESAVTAKSPFWKLNFLLSGSLDLMLLYAAAVNIICSKLLIRWGLKPQRLN